MWIEEPIKLYAHNKTDNCTSKETKKSMFMVFNFVINNIVIGGSKKHV